jgi:hypothetical protein
MPPTIDPAEFSDHGAYVPTRPVIDPAELKDLDDVNLHPPGSAGWALRQEQGQSAELPTPIEEEDRARTAEQKAKAKMAQANQQFIADAQEHQQSMAKAAAEKQTELETLLGIMDEHEARAVRMQAYLRALDAGHGNQRERQLHADTLALKLADYMVNGRAG